MQKMEAAERDGWVTRTAEILGALFKYYRAGHSPIGSEGQLNVSCII